MKIKHNILVAAIAITTSCGNAPCGCGGAPQTPAPHASKPGITATAKLHAPSAAKPSQ